MHGILGIMCAHLFSILYSVDVFMFTSSESSQQTQPDPSNKSPEDKARQGLVGPSVSSSAERNSRQTKSASPPPLSNSGGGQSTGKSTGQEKHSGSSKLRNLFRKKPKVVKVASEDVTSEKEKKEKESEGGLPASAVEGPTDEAKDEPKRNVMDQIKRYNEKDSAVKPNEKLAPCAAEKEKRETRSASPSAATSAKASEVKVDQEEKKTGLSKWMRSKKQHVRSSSPEVLKSDKEEKSIAKNQANDHRHPLEPVARSVGDVEECEKFNVSDRVKQYSEQQKLIGGPAFATDRQSKTDKPEGIAISSHDSEEKKEKGKIKSKGNEKEGKDNKTEGKNPKKGTKKEWNIFKRIGRRDSSSDMLDSNGKEVLGVDSSEANTLKEQELASDEAAVKLISVTRNTEGVDEVDSAAGVRDCKDSTGDERESSSPPCLDELLPDDKCVGSGTGSGPGSMKPRVSVHDQIRKMQVNTSVPSPVVRRSLSVSTQMR